MTNLIEVAEELEFVPKESLIQMAQNPNSRFPSYMVLSEIQRRTQMEKMYNAARMERPQTTVAQELVGEFSQPQGLAGAMTDDLGRLPNNFSDSVAPANSLMQMANGGLTGSDAIRQAETSLGREPTFSEIASSYNENQRLIREQEAEQKRIEAERIFGGLGKNESGADDVLDFFKDSGSKIGDFFEDRYYDDEGDFNYGTFISDASILVPGGAAAYLGRKALGGLLGKAFSAGKKGFQSLYSKPIKYVKEKPKGPLRTRMNVRADSPRGQELIKRGAKIRESKIIGREFAPGRAAATTAVLGQIAGPTVDYLLEDDPIKTKTKTKDNNLPQNNNLSPEEDKGDDGKKKDGLLGKIDPLDIAKLGGIILGAKGTGDIGQGITALASDVQQRRTAEQERLADEAYRQLQGDYLKSQKRMLDINIANAPTDLLLSKLEQLNKSYKLITAEVGGTDEEAKQVAIAIKLISDELTARTANTNTGQTNPEKQVQSFISEAP